MRELTCNDVAVLSAELALGIADAEDRAAAVAHLEHCASCRAEVRATSDVADELVGLVPPAQPPAGFESRVIADLPHGRAGGWRQAASRRRRYLAAAAVVAAAALATVGWLVAKASSPAPVSTSEGAVTASLLAGSRPVGEVVVVQGNEPWVSMAVHLTLGSTVVRCEVEGRQGGWATVGTFSIYDGYGYWAASLPTTSAVRTARLVLADGRVIATASVPASARVIAPKASRHD